MAYVVRQGTSEEELHEIIAIDQSVYLKEYCSTYEQVLERYERNRDSFLCVYRQDEMSEELAGYICFYPVTLDFENILVAGSYLNDSDLPPGVILSWEDSQSAVYIISVVVRPKDQHSEAIKSLMNAFDRLMDVYANNYKFNSIVAVTVSEAGLKCLKKSEFEIRRENDDGTHVMIKNLEVVL